MKKTFLASLLFVIGFASPVKAEPEWIEYYEFTAPFQTKLKTVHYIDKNILISNDGITIYAEKKTSKLLKKGSDKEYSKAQWKGINCKTRILARETDSGSLFTIPIPNTDKMSKKEIKDNPLAIRRYWDVYKIVCKDNNPTYIDEKSIDILDSEHPYNKSIYQSNLDTSGLTYNQFQSQLIRHKNKDADFEWFNWRKDGNDELYLTIEPVIKPTVNINNKSTKYKMYLLSDRINLDKYTKDEIDQMRVICLNYTNEFYFNPNLMQEHKNTCISNFPSVNKKTSNESNNFLKNIFPERSTPENKLEDKARKKCLKAKDYTGCMEYEMSDK
mgnify:CR=1 FL=1